jgi:hypothetical protein
MHGLKVQMVQHHEPVADEQAFWIGMQRVQRHVLMLSLVKCTAAAAVANAVTCAQMQVAPASVAAHATLVLTCLV